MQKDLASAVRTPHDLDPAPVEGGVAHPKRLARRLLGGETGRQRRSRIASLGGAVRELALGEDAAKIALAEGRDGARHLCDFHDVGSELESHRVPAYRP